MKAILIGCSMLVLAGCAATGSPPVAGTATGEQIRWYALAEGHRAAEIDHKPMVVDFFVPSGCARCARMVRDVYGNPEVAHRMNDEFIPIRIDLTGPMTADERALGEKFKYREDCLLLFLTPAGEIVTDPGGQKLCFADFIDAKWFLQYLDLAKEKAK